MATFSLLDRITGNRSFNLAAEVETGESVIEKGDINLKRVDKKELEAAYTKVPIQNQGINTLTQIIMSGEPELYHENNTIVKKFTNFLNNIGNVGNTIHWEELLQRIYLDQFIYGDAWVELIYNGNGDIVDLDIIDAKTIDYAKKSENKLALNEYGMPIGYEHKTGSHRMGGKAPDGVKLEAGSIFIPPKNISHFMLNRFGDGFYPMGLIEPSYDFAKFYLNLVYMYGEKAQELFPKIISYFGDERHEPNQQQLKDMLDKMKSSRRNTMVSVPHFVDMKILEAKHPEALLTFLHFFEDQMIVGMGLPKVVVTGLGEETNRSTLNVQTYLLILTTRDIIKRTTKTIEKTIFKPLAESLGVKEYPTIKWNFQKVEDSIKGSIEGVSDEKRNEPNENEKSVPRQKGEGEK